MDERTAQKPLGGWPALAALFAVLTVAATLGAGWDLVDQIAGWNIAFTAAAICALAGMLAARRASAAEHRYRWGCWAAAAACWLGGQIAWDVFSVIGFPASPNVADLCWYGFAVLVMAGLLRSPAETRTTRAVAIVEALPLVAAAMALTFAELWTHGGAVELSAGARLSALAYPALYVSAAILTLQVMVGGSLRQVRGPGPRLVLLGIVMPGRRLHRWTEQLLDAELRHGQDAGRPAVGPRPARHRRGRRAGRRPARAARRRRRDEPPRRHPARGHLRRADRRARAHRLRGPAARRAADARRRAR